MTAKPNPAEPAFRCVHSGNFPGLLEQLRLSLAVTTYQADKPMIVRSAGGKLSTLLRSFEQVTGGIIMDVENDEILASGFCMPHSPRLHQGELYVLNSGHGHLCRVDRNNGEVTTIASLPGYTRGLAFHGRLAFVGLSMIREKDLFGGLPIADQYNDTERKCGVCVVDLDTGQMIAFLYFEAGTTEIFDIQVLPGMLSPTVVGFQDETLDGVIVAPPGAWAKGATLPVAKPRS